MGGRCRDCRAVVRRAGLAMVAFAGAGPRGNTGRRGGSILASGSWSNCCLRHASAEDWTALRSHPWERLGARKAQDSAMSAYDVEQFGCLLLAQSRHPDALNQMSAFGGKADIG